MPPMCRMHSLDGHLACDRTNSELWYHLPAGSPRNHSPHGFWLPVLATHLHPLRFTNQEGLPIKAQAAWRLAIERTHAQHNFLLYDAPPYSACRLGFNVKGI